jgi:hypothetical protein
MNGIVYRETRPARHSYVRRKAGGDQGNPQENAHKKTASLLDSCNLLLWFWCGSLSEKRPKKRLATATKFAAALAIRFSASKHRLNTQRPTVNMCNRLITIAILELLQIQE